MPGRLPWEVIRLDRMAVFRHRLQSLRAPGSGISTEQSTPSDLHTAYTLTQYMAVIPHCSETSNSTFACSLGRSSFRTAFTPFFGKTSTEAIHPMPRLLWQMSKPHSWSRSSTPPNDSRKRTYIMTASWMISGDILKYRKGVWLISRNLSARMRCLKVR